MNYTSNLNLKKPGLSDYVSIQDINENMDILDAKLEEMAETDGDSQSNVVTFDVADDREAIASGETHATIFGKVAKWLADLKAVAFSGSYADLNNVPTTFAPSSHTHPWAGVTAKPETFPPSTHSHSWTSVTSKPTTFAPSAHNHNTEYYTKTESQTVAKAAASFDVVIRTQAEFNALIASSTWLGAKSVCFVGDGGTTAFTRSGMGLKIPQTVMNLQGLNGAKIEVTEFDYNGSTNKAALWYATQPDSNAGYWIDGLEVECIGIRTGVCFNNCTQLTNCTGSGTGAATGSFSGYGFYECRQLINCTGHGTGTATGTGTAYGIGFYECAQLMNCTGTGTGTGTGTAYGIGFGFRGCAQLMNCTGTDTGYGFSNCTQLTNCNGTGNASATTRDAGYGFNNCTQLTNCTGSGTGTATGYGFYDCNWVNGCKQGKISTTAFTGGIMYHVDEATVAAS